MSAIAQEIDCNKLYHAAESLAALVPKLLSLLGPNTRVPDFLGVGRTQNLHQTSLQSDAVLPDLGTTL